MRQLHLAHLTLIACVVFQSSTSAQEIVALDRLGRTYTSDQIDGNNSQNSFMMGGGVGCPTPCAAGIFELHFAVGSGFDDPVDGPARQEVARQVFQDYSQLIIPADDPCNGPNPAPFVRVWFPAPGGIVPPGAAALGSSLYNYVTINNTLIPYDDFTPATLQEGVIDGEVWRTINGGTDSWRSINYAIRRGAGNPPWLLFHGLVSVDFSAAPFYTGMALPVPPGMADLYSVIAHEATHMLGFHTFTNQTGLGFLNSRYYSRYDVLLDQGGTSWITDPLLCSGWSANTDAAFDLEPGGCITTVSGTYTTTPQPVYAPMPWDGSSLSHLDGICGSLPYLMNHDNLNPLGMSRVPLQEEVNVLCDIDYHTSTQHGTSGTGWDDTYHVRTTCGQRLAGVDDLISDCVTRPFYTYKQGQAAPLTIDDFLENDEDEANTSIGIIGTPQSYACMEVLLGGDNGAPPPASGGTSIDYEPDPGFVGWAVIRYRPVSVDGRLGCITYIFVEVWPPDVCGVEPCNILNGGTFEGLPLQSRTGAPHDSYQRTGASANSPDLFALDASLPPPNWLEMNGYNTMVGMCGPSAPISPGAGLPPNERYMTMVATAAANPNNEGVLFELCRPLLNGVSYTLEYKARTGGTCLRDLRFYAFQDRPCNPLQGLTNFALAGPCNNGVVPIQFVPLQSVASAPWQVQSTAFTFTGSQRNWIVAVSAGPTLGSISVDDFAIRPVITADATILPSCIGQATGSIALDIHYYPGSHTILWSNWATTATNGNLAPGSYTVTITDTDLGCASFTQTYIVPGQPCGDPFTITKTVAPMPTYAFAPVFFTITACNNTANQEPVALNEQFPANFVMTGSTPVLSWPSVTVTLPAGGCETYVINGYFTAIGTDENCVTLDPVGAGDDVQACVPTQILEGCPLVVYGDGGCVPGSTVDMCLGVHTIIPDVSAISYWIIYPDYMVPPSPGALTTPVITSPFSISSASIGVPEALSWPLGYMAVPVTVNFSPLAQVSPPYGFFCIDFTVGPSGVPAGVNTAWTWASAVSPNADPLLQHWNHVAIITAGSQAELWTQAYLIEFNGCPGLNMPDATFTIDQVLCTGEVSVTGNLTDPAAVHSWTWGDNRTTPINGAPTYTYNYFSTITDNQGWPVNPPIGPAAPGTYTITHTVVLDGVVASSTQEVTVAPCCQAGVVIPHGSLASLVGTVFSGTIDVQGQFIVDDDVLFQNCQVYMEPGAEIIVQNGWTLDVDNASFTACNGVMWKSITAESGAAVRIRSSYMDDAESLVSALDGSVIWVDGTQFHNNRVGIGIPDVGGTYNNVACWVSNSTFYSAGAMPQPYQGQSTAVGGKGFAALDVHHTTLDFTGGNNLIHSLSNGIVGYGSDMTVADCQMSNIQPDAAYAYSGNGAGIYANGAKNWNTLKQQGYGMNSSMPSFNGCRWGVYTEYMNVRSTDNRMLDMGTAYRVERSGYREVDILNNKVFTHLHGMELRSNDGAAHILVQNNDITFGDAQCIPCRGFTAILVTEGNYVAPNSRILNNTIRFMNAPNSRFGIALTSADSWVVAENNVLMANNAFNFSGIQMAGCRRSEVSCNSITGAGGTYPLDAQSAIRNLMGREPLISCNDMDLTANGILFNGVAYNTDVRGNQFHNHKWPLHLDATAIIDAQTLKGNLWDPNAATPVWGAWYEVSNLQSALSSFRYDPAIIGSGVTTPPTWSPSAWFTIYPGTNYDCANDHGEHYCSQFGGERCKDCLRELDDKIANDDLENNPYTEETKWMLSGDLYQKLDDSPDLLDEGTDLADFYADLQGSATAAFKAIGDEQLALYDLDESVTAQLQANRTQIEGLLAFVKDGMEELGDETLTASQRQAILASIGGYRQTINSLSAWNASALQLASTTKVLSAEGVRSNNATVATSELIEANEKAVNEVYLATVGKDADGLTSIQASELFDIANQCPMMGGNAVFKARSLYWLIDDSYNFDDQALCLQHGIIVKSLSAKTINAVAVVPNPASDEATLVFDRELDEPGVFVVYDAVGAEVMRHVVPIEMPRLAFSTASLPPALYHYQVRGPSGVLGLGKLTIVR